MIAATAGLNVGAGSTEITDTESAIRAAKNYTKGRCTAETPCTYKPEHEGKQWRVWFAGPAGVRWGGLAAVFGIGLFFGIVYHRSGNLWIPAVMHGLWPPNMS
jgi:hypothetical protein